MSTEVPDGYAHALHPITDYDHGGYAIIASGCSLVFVLIFAGLRLWNCARIGHSIDDFVLFAGTVCPSSLGGLTKTDHHEIRLWTSSSQLS